MVGGGCLPGSKIRTLPLPGKPLCNGAISPPYIYVGGAPPGLTMANICVKVFPSPFISSCQIQDLSVVPAWCTHTWFLHSS